MLEVLPQWMINKWADKIAEYQEQNNDDFPLQQTLLNLSVHKLSVLITQSYRSLVQVQSRLVLLRDISHRHRVSNCISLSTSMSSRKSCLCCGGSHSLQKCYKFIGFSYEERVAFIKEHRLCFGCFNRGYQSKDCRFRLKCNVCQRSHPTLLH